MAWHYRLSKAEFLDHCGIPEIPDCADRPRYAIMYPLTPMIWLVCFTFTTSLSFVDAQAKVHGEFDDASLIVGIHQVPLTRRNVNANNLRLDSAIGSM